MFASKYKTRVTQNLTDVTRESFLKKVLLSMCACTCDTQAVLSLNVLLFGN